MADRSVERPPTLGAEQEEAAQAAGSQPAAPLKRTASAKVRRSASTASRATEADHQVTAPGEVPEEAETQEAQKYSTFMDTRQGTGLGMEQGDSAGGLDNVSPATVTDPVVPKESMAEQSEMEFPTAIERSPSRLSSRASPKVTVKKTTYLYDDRDFHGLNPKDYGIDFEEEQTVYEPPNRDDKLPDLHHLMASLDNGEGNLAEETEPPSLFTRPEHVTSYKKISELKMQIEEANIGDYVGEFEEGVRDDVLMIGSIGLEEVQEEEKRLRDEHIAYQEQEARIVRERQQQILVREEEAKKRVAVDLKEKRRLMQRAEDIQQQRERLMTERLNKAFRRSENQLMSALEERKGEVKTMYGDLILADSHYGGSRGRRWKVDWDKTPQPIQIKLKALRGVKDKLPSGRYVLMVSLYNRLGGHIMRWSNLKGQQWGGATLPIRHDGHFYNTEIKLDQSVFTVLPAKPGIRPGMVLVFELFLLRGAVVPTDRVVGWGCFPITDAQFDVIEGKYKCPFLRGEMDTMIDKHEKVEGLMASDLDHWLCNAYFEIVKLPRYLAGQKEYEVELQFSSGILAYPDRVNTGEEYRDGEAPIPGSMPDLKSTPGTSQMASSQSSLRASNLLRSDTSLDLDDDDIKKPSLAYDDPLQEKQKRLDSFVKDGNDGDQKNNRPLTTYGNSRGLHKEKKAKLDDDSDDTDYDDDDVYLMKKEEGFYPVKGHPGMYYKKHRNNQVDLYHKKLYTLLPKTPLLAQKRRKKHLTYLEQLEEHTFAVKQGLGERGRLPQKGWHKLQYVSRQMMAELGLSQWRSREFWGMLLIFILIFFVRMYIHYLTQWVYLQALEIPVNKLDFLPYTVNLNYQNTLLLTREEIAMVLLGPFGTIIVFTLLVICSWLSQRILGSFPEVGSKFIVSFGIQAFLDPFLILAVDCILRRYRNLGGDNPIADFAKLYWHFYLADGSGLGGIFITIFLYTCTCFAAGSILYMYFLRLHNNGRMLDIYWRLHGDEEVFFLPYDLELSNQELCYICRRSEQWRGEEGERKKVAVYDYIWEEETIEETVWDENGRERRQTREGKKEITTHVSVHTLHLDGLRELYRHFLRIPDGAIVEVFGDMTVAGMDKDVTKVLAQEAKNLENLMGSQYNMKRGQSAFSSGGFDLEGTETNNNEDTSSGSAGSLPDKKNL